MHFSSIYALVDAHLQTLLTAHPLKQPAISLNVTSKDPLVLEDSGKIQALPQHDDLEIYLQTYDKIEVGSAIRLDNVAIGLEFAQGHAIAKIRLSSKQVIVEVGLEKQRELRNFELRLSVVKGEVQLPLSASSFNCLRRLERQELMKKYYKPSNADPLAFTGKNIKQNECPTATALDSQSISYLRKLLPFVDKEELFKVLLRKPLMERKSKKALRLSIIPNNMNESAQFEIKKKAFNRMTVLQLLSEYQARDSLLQ